MPDVETPPPPVVPTPPAAEKPVETGDTAKAKTGRKKRGTILTSSRGILAQPEVGKKALLGN